MLEFDQYVSKFGNLKLLFICTSDNWYFCDIPEYEIYTKKCKHDDGIANYSCGIADLVEEEKPLIHQPAGDKDHVSVLC